MDDILLNEVDIAGFETVAAATPAASTTPAAAMQVSSANSSATLQLLTKRKRGRPKGSKNKATRMTMARKLAMQQGNDV